MAGRKTGLSDSLWLVTFRHRSCRVLNRQIGCENLVARRFGSSFSTGLALQIIFCPPERYSS
jgi:hypothetical protein